MSRGAGKAGPLINARGRTTGRRRGRGEEQQARASLSCLLCAPNEFMSIDFGNNFPASGWKCAALYESCAE